MKPADLVLALAVMSLAFPHASPAAPPPPPPLCSATGKPPVMVGEPLRFCGYDSGMTCCDTAQDTALGALIQSMNLPKPDAMVLKKSLCQKRCRPQGWSNEQQTLDSLVEQLLAPQNTWLLLAAPFILWIWYRVSKNFVASCLGAQTTTPPSPRNDRPKPNGSICASMLCMCCSTMSYMSLNRNDDGESTSTRGNNARSSGASIEMNEV